MKRWGLLTLAGLLAGLVAFVWLRHGRKGFSEGMDSTKALFVEIGPIMVLGIALSGFLGVLLPREAIVKWIGADSGWRGLLMSSLAGLVLPMSPRFVFPTLAVLVMKGAGMGPVCAFITSASLCGFQRILISEVPSLGWRFVAVRFLASFWVAPVVGFLAGSLQNWTLAQVHAKAG